MTDKVVLNFLSIRHAPNYSVIQTKSPPVPKKSGTLPSDRFSSILLVSIQAALFPDRCAATRIRIPICLIILTKAGPTAAD
jgi:hypothetical protein